MSKGFGTPGNSFPVTAAVGPAGGKNASTKRRRPSGRANWGIETPEIASLKKIFAVLGEQDAPYIEAALDDVGNELASEARKAAGRWGAGVIGQNVRFLGVGGAGMRMKAEVVVDHPAANSFEFGRSYYYRRATKLATTSNRGKKKWFGAYIGNNQTGYRRKKGSMKGQERYRVTWEGKPGMKARPIMGVLHNHDQSYPAGAMQAVWPYALKRLQDGIAKEWERIAEGGD